jgi:hypothetical protein
MKLRSQPVYAPFAPVQTGPRARPSRDERTASKAISMTDDERERYVLDLKRRVLDGRYNPTGMEIAEAIVAHRLSDDEF